MPDFDSPECPFAKNADCVFVNLPDLYFEYLYCRANGLVTYYDSDWDMPLRSFAEN